MIKYPHGTFSVLVICFMAFLATINCSPFSNIQRNYGKQVNKGIDQFQIIQPRLRRSSEHAIISECIFMTSKEGQFFYKTTTENSDDLNSVCGIYIVAEPHQKIEIKFNYFNVPCRNGGLVAFVDGWELNGELFPSQRDYGHPNLRFREFCDERKIKKAFTSTSNVALIQHRIPFKGYGFTITVRFVKNPTPCNVLLQDFEEIYTLRNYEKRSNCSVSTLFPSAIRLISLNVGITRADTRSFELETGTIHKCNKRGLDDFVEIGGSIGLDNSKMLIADSVCGLNSNEGRFEEFIACGTTTIRMVSSGIFSNSITVTLRQLDGENDLNNFMSVTCPIEEIE